VCYGYSILQAGEAGYVETHIICPGCIIGEARGPVKAGSLFVNALLQLAMDRQRACYYGEGTNTLFMVWYNFLHQPFSFQIRFRS